MQRAIKKGGNDKDSYIVRKIEKVVCYVIQRFQEDIPGDFLAAVAWTFFNYFFPVMYMFLSYFIMYYILLSDR